MRSVPGLLGYVVILVLFMATGLAATLYMVGQSSSTLPWETTTTIKAEFAEVPAVTTKSSQQVRIAGVAVGKITDTEVTDRGTALLTMTIRGHQQVYDNAVAVLRAVNPLNQMYVNIEPGGPPGKLLTDGATIPLAQTRKPVETDQILDKFDPSAQAGITDMLAQADVALAQAPRDFGPGINATDKTLIDLRPALDALQVRRDKLRQLTTSVGQIAEAIGGDQDRAVRLADSTEQTLGVLAQHDQDLQTSIQELPGVYGQLRRTFSATQDLTQQLDPTLDDLRKVSDKLPDTLDHFTDTVDTLGDTMRAAKPVVSEGRHLVSDLRPFARDLNDASEDLRPVTREFPRITGLATDYLTELRAFTYNTSSVFGVQDARSGIIRGHVIAPLPDGIGIPPGQGGPTRYVPTPAESGTPYVTTPKGGH
jgi:phospholipid/cholesterol/gamma-HCH transport system substrate-binding protein